ncbi:MAG: DUF2497 domain-containing protein, partial [Pseudomonadota bacterium]
SQISEAAVSTPVSNVIDEDLEDLFEDEPSAGSKPGPASGASSQVGSESGVANFGDLRKDPTAVQPVTAASDLNERFPDATAASKATPSNGPLIPPTARSVAAMASNASSTPKAHSNQTEPAASEVSSKIGNAAAKEPTLLDRLSGASERAEGLSNTDGKASDDFADLGVLSINPTETSSTKVQGKTDASLEQLRPFGKDLDPPQQLRPSRERPWDAHPNTNLEADPKDQSKVSKIDFDNIVPGQDRDHGPVETAQSASTQTADDEFFDSLPKLDPRPVGTPDKPTSASAGAEEADATIAGQSDTPEKFNSASNASSKDATNQASEGLEQVAKSGAASAFSTMTGLPSFSEKPAAASPQASGTEDASPDSAAAKPDAQTDNPIRENTVKASPDPLAVAETPAKSAEDEATTVDTSTTKPSMAVALERATGLTPTDEAVDSAAETSASVKTSEQIDDAVERTLDETAAELLRPMVREWLDTNMPRIFEKALQIELAKGIAQPTPLDTAGNTSGESVDTPDPTAPSKH